MKRIALVAAGAAVAGLTACTHSTVPSAAPARPPSSSATTTRPPSPSAATASTPAPTHSATLADCRQQYNTWQQGPGKGLVATLSAVGSAAKAGDSHALTTELKAARPVVARAAKYPVPSCADPKGYWTVLLMHVNAAAASTGSASSLQAAINGVPTITNALTAELQRTGG